MNQQQLDDAKARHCADAFRMLSDAMSAAHPDRSNSETSRATRALMDDIETHEDEDEGEAFEPGTELRGDEYRNLSPNTRDPDRDYETWRDDTENHTEKW